MNDMGKQFSGLLEITGTTFSMMAIALVGLTGVLAAILIYYGRAVHLLPRPTPTPGVPPPIVRDALTRLLTHDSLHSSVANALASGVHAAIIVLRFDNLDAVTIAHGPKVSELALVASSERLRLLWPGQQWARMVGNVFGIVVSRSDKSNDFESAALATLRSVERPIALPNVQVDLVASLGIALLPEHAETAESALRVACSAMARASDAGGSQWRVFNPDQERLEVLRASIKRDLASAIAAGDIIPYYQPIVDLSTGRIAGLEVLARWQHETRGVLPPDVFIPMADEMHLTGSLTQALMRRVLADARQWPDEIYFAFNVSPGQFRELIGLVRDPPTWPEGTLASKRLEIEITENALIEDLAVAKAVIEVLQLNGIKIVLDDFGIGYSNFFHLRELPFDKIKIDKSFVLDLGLDPRAEACVRTMLALGASLGIDMVAEGVEKQVNADYLAKLGCQFGQGYLYSPPVEAADVPRLLVNQPLVKESKLLA